MSSYQRRLKEDVARWRDRGLIGRSAADEILREVEERPPAVTLWAALGVVGAALLVLAALSFVAANWEATPRIWRVALLLGALWAAFAVAAVLGRRGLGAGAHAALLTASGLFGANIMLIGQMYHLAGDPTDAVLLWAVGALAAGALLRSPPSIVLAAGLFALWSEWSVWGGPSRDWAPHWPALIAWGLLAAASWRAAWRGGAHLLILSMSLWVFVNIGFRLTEDTGEPGLYLVALIGAAAFLSSRPLAAVRALDEALGHDAAARIGGYGFALGFAGLFFAQIFAEDVQGDGVRAALASFPALAALTLALLVGTLWVGIDDEDGATLWLAYAALSIELTLIYLRTIGGLLGSALFFLIAGLLVAALAWLGFVLHKRRRAMSEAAS